MPREFVTQILLDAPLLLFFFSFPSHEYAFVFSEHVRALGKKTTVENRTCTEL